MQDQIRVLHVDDDPQFAELVESFLHDITDRFEIVTETRAADALAYLDRDASAVDCIVSDYALDGMDGIDFLEAVRTEYPELPFLLFTGKGSEAVASEALRHGVTDYLQKQSGTEQYELLANRIQNAVQHRRERRRADKLDRIRTVIQDVNQVLVRSHSRETLESEVCTVLSNADPYLLVWIGGYDSESQTVTPRAGAGEGVDYLDETTITAGPERTGRGPTGRAIRNSEIAITDSIPDDPDYAPWAEQATERGYMSSAAIPLIFDDRLYGVLNVYSATEYSFDEQEQALLSELGEDIARGLYRIDREQEIDRLKELHETVLANVRETVLVTDDDGEFTYICPNVGFIFGYDSEEVAEIGSVERLFGGRLFEPGTLEDTKELQNIESTVKDSNGTEIDVLVTVRQVDIEDGTRLYSIRDISELKERERKLQAQNELLEEFATVLSHDLRSPLNVATEGVRLAGEDCESEHLEVTQRAHERMSSLIDSALTLARGRQRKQRLETVDLAELARHCWQTVETGEATVSIDTEQTVRADTSRLKQLLENLIQYMVANGERTAVTVGELEGGFYVASREMPAKSRPEASDTGHPTDLDRTGFDLRVAEQVIKAHGWELAVTDDGRRFKVTGVESARS